jgi:signal transduction histidine kinase
MSDLGLVIPIGLISLVVFFFLRRIDDSPMTAHWAKAWIALYSAGILAGAKVYTPLAANLSQIPLQLFAAYLLAGALAFRDRKVPGWIVPAAVVIGGLRALLAILNGDEAGYVATLFTVPPFTLTAAWVLWRGDAIRHWRSPEGWLAPPITVIAGLTILDPLVRLAGAPTLPLYVAWLTVALSVAFVQLMVIEDRVRARRDELLASVEHHADLLGEERSRLRTLIDGAPVGIIFVDADGIVRATNPILVDQLGADPTIGWVGRRSRDMQQHCAPRLQPESRAELTRCLRDIRSGKVDSIDGVDIQFSQPVDRVLRLYSSPVRSRSGEAAGHLWVTLDVTRERRLDRQLQEARRMETLGTLAGGVAHDFNNHLTPVLGNAWLMRQSLPEDDPLQAVARDIEEAAKHCATMTRDLLTVARRAPARPRPVDPRGVVEAAVESLGRTLSPHQCLDLEVEEDLPQILADPDQLARVLENVLDNAKDATEGRGTISVMAFSQPADDRDRSSVVIVVRDNGRGMDDHTRAHIFEPFFTTKDVGDGSGLGLAIAYGIIEAHGASIGVESKPGAGTEVCIRWPTARERVQPLRREPSAAGGSLP